MGVQKSAVVMGIAKQAAFGTAATQPTFAHGVSGGGLSTDINQEPDELTSALRTTGSVNRDQVANSGELSTRAYLKSVGLYLLAAMGAVATTGSGPYTHVFTVGELSWFTLFEKIGNEIFALRDCKIDEFKLSWEGNKPLELSVSGMGTVISFPASLTPGTNETDSVDYFTPVGGTFKLDVDSATPVTSTVTAGEITLKNNTEHIFYSGSIEAADIDVKKHEAEISLTTVPTSSLADWRTILTGASNGTTVRTSPLEGSFEVSFVNGTASLKAEGTRVAFLCELPEADPGGGYAELELSGVCLMPSGAGTAPIKFTLVNAQASYTS